ncbi:MAG: hypothetical protein JOZ18_21515 [Chloroflexi bacterium]|nr:hypothetical protein [Chloroflexota bacterium]
MLAQTAPLSQVDLKQSNENKNNDGSMMSLRRMLPSLLINAGVPLLINILAQPHMSSINALLLASSAPALFTLGTLIWKKRIDAMSLLVVVGFLLSAVFALLFQSPRLLLLQHSAVSGVFGVAMLISLLLPRPVLFYIARSMLTQNDPERMASFNADWAFPQVRTFYRISTMVWGCFTVAQVLLLAVLAFILPIPLMLTLGPILNFATMTPVIHWSMSYTRKNKRIFDQLRRERDAAAAKISY